MTEERATERVYLTNFVKGGSPIEVRKAQGGGHSRLIGGYAALFGKRSQPLGGFVEIVENSFFRKSAGDGYPGVICRYNHDDNMLLGTTAAGTLQLKQDDIGLDYTVDLPLCREDVLEMTQRTDIRNSSFAFQVFEQDWEPSSGGYPVRHLLSGRLVDVSPVCTPAYLDSTAGVRSLSKESTNPALLSLSRRMNVPYEDVYELASRDELRQLFVRTDQQLAPAPVPVTATEEPPAPRPAPTPQPKGMDGKAALAKALEAKQADGKERLLETYAQRWPEHVTEAIDHSTGTPSVEDQLAAAQQDLRHARAEIARLSDAGILELEAVRRENERIAARAELDLKPSGPMSGAEALRRTQAMRPIYYYDGYPSTLPYESAGLAAERAASGGRRSGAEALRLTEEMRQPMGRAYDAYLSST
jgi:HK97 family phage prohead protease